MKRIISLLLMVLMILSLLLCFPLTASADSMYIRKVVSLVYDDSTSMNGDKWAYANYATQVFTGMLNNEDKLYITYMSAVQDDPSHEPDEVDLSSGAIQKSVDSIRDHDDRQDTPFAAVQTAYDKLLDVDDSNPNTQYWLVVISDGDFNEIIKESDDEKKDFLNEKMESYTDGVMPNGTRPQITFLSIGDNIVPPDENTAKGIYTYQANDASAIVGAMSDLSDRISGRTRLDSKDIKQISDTKIQVSSSIPLLNIAVLAQETDARILQAIRNNENDIPVSREASVSFSGYTDLAGTAYLLGDSQSAIGSGTYDITFDKKIDLDDLDILFEPALEMRMTVTVNGTELSDYRDLKNSSEGDVISVSCKVYEMGTDKEIDFSLLPGDTKYEISVNENGANKKKVTDKNMQLSDYKLSNVQTELTAAVTIEGFNPIDYTIKFTPAKYVPKTVYTIESEFDGDKKSIKYDDISSNTDLSVRFTVFADGVAMTDPDAVKALNPQISVAQTGNEGAISYSNDGKIVFTPNKANIVAGSSGSYDVDVTCTLADGTNAKATYTVLLADYQVVAVDVKDTIKKTEFYGNTVGASFYVLKDGVKLSKEEVEAGITATLDDDHSDLKTKVTVDNDGVITVVPYSEEEYKLNFGRWFVNWAHYWGLNKNDVTVTLSHPYGTASSVIDVTQESVPYRLLNVWLPFVLELAVLLFLIWWVYCILAKPKFAKNASVYIADLYYEGGMGNHYHQIGVMERKNLNRFNKLKYRWKPTLKTTVVSLGKIKVSAGDGGSIICNSKVWYKGNIEPLYTDARDAIEHPEKVRLYIDDNGGYMNIRTLSPFDAETIQPVTTLDRPDTELYYVKMDMEEPDIVDGKETITSGTIFVYVNNI